MGLDLGPMKLSQDYDGSNNRKESSFCSFTPIVTQALISRKCIFSLKKCPRRLFESNLAVKRHDDASPRSRVCFHSRAALYTSLHGSTPHNVHGSK